MRHKVATGIWVERSVCQVTGVLFNTAAQKEEGKKKVYDFSSMEGQGNRSDIELEKQVKT